jgi:hypothetical protein
MRWARVWQWWTSSFIRGGGYRWGSIARTRSKRLLKLIEEANLAGDAEEEENPGAFE